MFSIASSTVRVCGSEKKSVVMMPPALLGSYCSRLSTSSLLFAVEQGHQLLALVFRQVADEVGKVVRRQMFQDASQFFDRRLGHHLRAQAGRNWLKTSAAIVVSAMA
jgi:hypothetical protein